MFCDRLEDYIDETCYVSTNIYTTGNIQTRNYLGMVLVSEEYKVPIYIIVMFYFMIVF